MDVLQELVVIFTIDQTLGISSKNDLFDLLTLVKNWQHDHLQNFSILFKIQLFSCVLNVIHLLIVPDNSDHDYFLRLFEFRRP